MVVVHVRFFETISKFEISGARHAREEQLAGLNLKVLIASRSGWFIQLENTI